jgi:hypothetical protein
MNQDEQHSTILLTQPADWEKTEIQGLPPDGSEDMPEPAPSRLGYYVAGLLSLVAVLVWVFVLI